MTATRRVTGALVRRGAAVAAIALALAPGAARTQTELGQGYDTSLPIEITADSLEVENDRQVATFRGNVDAVQGEMNLRADQLIVYYRSESNDQNSIRLIEAEGNVFLSSPTEMAQGDKGVYNVDADTIELIGSVVLTRGDNVIRGDRLYMNLSTGQSKVVSDTVASGGQGRVKALFVPKSGSTESSQ